VIYLFICTKSVAVRYLL